MKFSTPCAALLAASSLALVSSPVQAALRLFMPFNAVAGAPGSPPHLAPGSDWVGDASGAGVNWQYGVGTPAVSGGVLQLDGEDDSIHVNLDVNPSAMPQMSWGAWVLSSSVAGVRQFLSHDDGGHDRTLGIDTRANPPGALSAFTGRGLAGDSQVAALDTWYFVAGVYDQPAGTMQLWVDDRRIDAPTGFHQGLTTMAIGKNPGFGEHFKGQMDNVFVFDQALSPTQIQAIRLGGESAILAVAAVPEPGTWALMALGLGALSVARRRA